VPRNRSRRAAAGWFARADVYAAPRYRPASPARERVLGRSVNTVGAPGNRSLRKILSSPCATSSSTAAIARYTSLTNCEGNKLPARTCALAQRIVSVSRLAKNRRSRRVGPRNASDSAVVRNDIPSSPSSERLHRTLGSPPLILRDEVFTDPSPPR